MITNKKRGKKNGEGAWLIEFWQGWHICVCLVEADDVHQAKRILSYWLQTNGIPRVMRSRGRANLPRNRIYQEAIQLTTRKPDLVCLLGWENPLVLED